MSTVTSSSEACVEGVEGEVGELSGSSPKRAAFVGDLVGALLVSELFITAST